MDDLEDEPVKPAEADGVHKPGRRDDAWGAFGTLGAYRGKNATDTYGEYCATPGRLLAGKTPCASIESGPMPPGMSGQKRRSAGLADECEVQLTYSIGSSRPVSIQLDTFNTARIAEEEIASLVKRHFDFRLAAIVKEFDLRIAPQEQRTAFSGSWLSTAMWANGHGASLGENRQSILPGFGLRQGGFRLKLEAVQPEVPPGLHRFLNNKCN